MCCFARAAATYEGQAAIQYYVADKLMAHLEQNLASSPQRILEIGSCTGLLTKRLAAQFPDLVTLYVNDLVPEFAEQIRGKTGHKAECTYLPGDIESIEIPGDLDLIISSSTFHWMEDFPALVKKLHTHMRSGGTLAFTMYSKDNLQELRTITGIGLSYFSLAEIRAITGKYFSLTVSDEERVTYAFASPMDVLTHLRETGVNSLDGTTWNRTRLNRFIDEYVERYGSDQQVSLTYHPAYIIASKS